MNSLKNSLYKVEQYKGELVELFESAKRDGLEIEVKKDVIYFKDADGYITGLDVKKIS